MTPKLIAARVTLPGHCSSSPTSYYMLLGCGVCVCFSIFSHFRELISLCHLLCFFQAKMWAGVGWPVGFLLLSQHPARDCGCLGWGGGVRPSESSYLDARLGCVLKLRGVVTVCIPADALPAMALIYGYMDLSFVIDCSFLICH